MTDIQIDISEDEDDLVTVENTHGFSYTIHSNGVALSINWDQFVSLYEAVKEYWEDSETTPPAPGSEPDALQHKHEMGPPKSGSEVKS